MERIMSQEERIRKAEETYYRRCQNRNIYYYPNYKENTKYNEKNEKNKKIKTIVKMIIQIIICLIIYATVYIMQNSEEELPKTIINKAKEFISEDIKIQDIQNNIGGIENTIYSFFNLSNDNIVDNTYENTTLQNEEINSGQENLISNTETQEANLNQSVDESLAIGGAEENEIIQSESQEDLDIEYVKTNYSIIWPLEGIITSGYGLRTPTEIVTANHKGIDIGGDIGTEIKAAMSGTVTLVSTEGDYGNHIQIENEDIITLYAHCSLLCVEEGQKITQGEKIAEVGETGRATGPHLHFEIRRDGRTMNPEKVLS